MTVQSPALPRSPDAPPTLDRRALLVGGGAIAAGLAGYQLLKPLWQPHSSAFIAKDQRYDGPIEQTIRDGLMASGLDPRAMAGRKVLLKVNLVEPTRTAPQVTTHPAMVLATAEVFRRWGAQVVVGEASGHMRDTEMALVESGMAPALDAAGLEFVDLNYEDVAWVKNAGRASKLDGFYFPRPVMEADLIVSMPKLKTHHWVGMTVSLKNMYGVLPGIKYGWPKNVLHHAGIPQTVFDINASLPKTIAVVDGIVGMEGDGPIMGSPKKLGLIVIGTNLAAVDATCARIIGLDPARVNYLQLSADRIGPIADGRIAQRGEDWRRVASPFVLLDRPELQRLRLAAGARLS
ncbi:MAG TPA: DUF362 domain-containing protein [Pirellulales bacterium]|jgi:uncharacterized protein (DUF362 family)|nr:DUF362 domain-containing protein [Pirellulales bacterium]